jgi:hypothetical protein
MRTDREMGHLTGAPQESPKKAEPGLEEGKRRTWSGFLVRFFGVGQVLGPRDSVVIQCSRYYWSGWSAFRDTIYAIWIKAQDAHPGANLGARG